MKKLTLDKIYITSFGKLDHVMVTPQSGIGLMALPNESGKTTFAMFIKFIFYGFVGTRSRTVADNERTLYMPWNGSNAEGAIELTYGDEKYRIDRSVNPQGKEKLSVIDLSTRKQVFADRVPGEVFFGVGEELFAKTVFFKQLVMPTNGDKALAESLRNIVVSADERDSADNAASRLAKMQGELTNRQHHGRIHDAEAEAAKYSEEFTVAESAAERLSELNASIASNTEKIDNAERELAKLEKELEAIESFEALQTLLRLKAYQEELDAAEKEYNDARMGFDSDAFAAIGGAGVFMSRHGDYITASREAEAAGKRYAAAEAESKAAADRVPKGIDGASADDIGKHKKHFGVFWALALLVLLGAAACFIASLTIPAVIALVVSALLLVLAFRSRNYTARLAKQCGCETADELLRLLSEKPSLVREAANAASERDKALEQKENAERALAEAKQALDETIKCVVSDSSDEEYNDKINSIIEEASRISQLKTRFEAAERTLAAATEGIDAVELGEKAKRYNGKRPERDRKTVEQGIRFYTSQKAELEIKNGKLEHEKSILIVKHGDAAVIKGKLDAANARVLELKRFNSALLIASEVLKETGEYIKSSVSPRISAAASEYFARLTDQKYQSLKTDTDLALTFGDEFESHSSEFLSAGTRECAYIALRLALVDAMYPDVSVPLIFDDAFVCIDDDRLPHMMQLLGELSADRQITIISCSDREKRALDSASLPYTEQELEQC